MAAPSLKKPSPGSVCARPCNRTGAPIDYVLNRRPSELRTASEPRKVALQDFLGELDRFSFDEFQTHEMAEFVRRHPIDLESLQNFLFFEKGRYTRNLLRRTNTYETILLCWEQGGATPIHNHGGQSCWVYVLSGQLSFTNYHWLGCDRKERIVHLEQSTRIPLAAEGSMNVIDEKDAIHVLANDEQFDERAISLHLYARPLDECAVYDLSQGTCQDRTLSYYSVDGVQRPVAQNFRG